MTRASFSATKHPNDNMRSLFSLETMCADRYKLYRGLILFYRLSDYIEN